MVPGNKTATVVPRTFAAAIHEPYLTAMSKENLPGGFRNACLYPVDWGKALAKTEKYEQLQRVAVKRDCSQFRHTDKQLIYDDDATHDDHNDDAGDMSPSWQPAQKRVRHFLSWSVVDTDKITERSRVREKAGEWKKNELSNVRRRGRRECSWHRKVEWRRNREIEWDEWKSEEKLRGAHFCRCKTGCTTKRCGCRSNSEEGKCGIHCLCVNCCNKVKENRLVVHFYRNRRGGVFLSETAPSWNWCWIRGRVEIPGLWTITTPKKTWGKKRQNSPGQEKWGG